MENFRLQYAQNSHLTDTAQMEVLQDVYKRQAIVPGVQGCLEENMVLTIEPGVYVPGVGGIRIEDEILVTSEGPEILTGLRTERFVL